MHSKNTPSAARRGRMVWLAVIASSGFLLGSCAQNAGDRSEEDAAGDAATWRNDIASSDARARAQAVDVLPGSPGEDGLAVLEEVAIRDEDAHVRERAVIAYEQLAGKRGERFLKDIALGDESPEVRSAALAALEKIRTEHPSSPRSWVKIEHPDHFLPGQTFAVRVRFGSSQSAPRARLGMRLPKGFVVSDAHDVPWRGAIEAGKENEATFQLTAPSEPVEGSLQLSLVVDYPEQLDIETLREKVRVEVDTTEGRFAPMPPPRTVSVNRAEVRP